MRSSNSYEICFLIFTADCLSTLKVVALLVQGASVLVYNIQHESASSEESKEYRRVLANNGFFWMPAKFMKDVSRATLTDFDDEAIT